MGTTAATSYVASLSISAPTSGVAAGGAVLAYYGGYKSHVAMNIMQVMSLMGIVVVLPMPFLNNFPLFGSLLWLCFFIGGFIMPTLTGLLLSSVSDHLRGPANALSQFGQNAFGLMPAPILYGFISFLIN